MTTSSVEYQLTLIFLVTLIFFLVSVIGQWAVFQKAGRHGWIALIPFYNSWVLFEISDKPGWWMLFALLPVVGFVVYVILYIVAMLELASRFGKGKPFAILGLVIFSLIGFLIIGFGDDKYSTPAISNRQ